MTTLWKNWQYYQEFMNWSMILVKLDFVFSQCFLITKLSVSNCSSELFDFCLIKKMDMGNESCLPFYLLVHRKKSGKFHLCLFWVSASGGLVLSLISLQSRHPVFHAPHFHSGIPWIILEKEMATHSSVIAWKIPWKEEPGWLQCMSCRELDMTEYVCIHTYYP